jgi:hypothetical protein
MTESHPTPRLPINPEAGIFNLKNMFAHVVNGIVTAEEWRRAPLPEYVPSPWVIARREALEKSEAESEEFQRLALGSLVSPNAYAVPLQEFYKGRHLARAEALGSYTIAIETESPRFVGVKKWIAGHKQRYHQWRISVADKKINFLTSKVEGNV